MSANLKFIIRVDSSCNIGTGHVMRCLSLAKALYQRGASVEFICRELPGNNISLIKEAGFKVFILPYNSRALAEKKTYTIYERWLAERYKVEIDQSKKIVSTISRIDMLIIDHYALDEKWENALRPYAKKIFVIDDLANRKHDCDFLLDQNYPNELHSKYKSLTSLSCTMMLGQKYALLRPEFIKLRAKVDHRFHKVERIFVFMGGGDPNNITLIALSSLQKAKFFGHVDVVVGAGNPNGESISIFCNKQNNFQLHYQINYMAELMAQADFAICASGSTTWERCCLGLPGVVVTLAQNQEHIALEMQRLGMDLYLGKGEQVTEENFIEIIKLFLANPEKLKKMSEVGMNLVDGNGIKRVIDTLFLEKMAVRHE